MTDAIVVPPKRCSRCKRVFPATSSFFNGNKNKKSGFEYHCRGCRYGWSDDEFQEDVTRKTLIRRGYKQCSICAEIKPFNEYFKAEQCIGGCRPDCIVCDLQMKREHNAREDIKTKIREYRRRPDVKARQRERENRPEIKAKKSVYDKREDRKAKRREDYKKEDVKVRRRIYYQRPDIRARQQEQGREYSRRIDVKQKAKQYVRRPEVRVRRNKYQRERYNKSLLVRGQMLVAGMKRRARKMELPLDFTFEQWQQTLDYFRHQCAACGRSPSESHLLAADHWEALTKGGGTTDTNIVPLCHTRKGHTGGCCNLSKSNKNPYHWLVEEFGEEKADEIRTRIQNYFKWVKTTLK